MNYTHECEAGFTWIVELHTGSGRDRREAASLVAALSKVNATDDVRIGLMCRRSGRIAFLHPEAGLEPVFLSVPLRFAEEIERMEEDRFAARMGLC